ncbi:retropepsin-like aspartic protease family protein [Algibacter lectus]|uniref:Clan AA aspartic protease (TIGR02281 family) n=1 Tax=Algibacter lectus TaxID=221126 RepID=A0A4R8MHT3_9FLAO|nr:retropepsin-like aspartic protease [Algibacter lectus]MWW23781.1 TIGR02281 family clan AA aspartic protease [Algibacter lectus]TDY63535.1 clan AA aspartic protease (TIGR02281 family) [Algibacter lectus]
MKIKLIITYSVFLFCLNIFSQVTIEMKKINGILQIPCKVNSIPMNFIFDTGATDVSLSITEAKFLIKQGLLTETDFAGNVNYQIANGDLIEGTQVNLKTINIGGIILENIQASIIHQQNSPLLLGQSAISKLGPYTIVDNKLIFGNIENNSKQKKIHLLDDKYGYRNIKLDTEISAFKKLIKLGSNSSGSLYDYEPLSNNLKNLYTIDFHKLLLGFSNFDNKLEIIILLKRYQSDSSNSPEKTQNTALDEFENITANFIQTLGTPTNYEDLKKEPFDYVWESDKVILRATFKTKKYEIDDNGNLEVHLSNTITFSKKKKNKGF